MRIAFFVDRFPCLSETFILNQITGLIDRGHEVDIYCDRPSNTVQMHLDVEKYQLLQRTYQIRIRSNTYKTVIWRYFKGIFLLLFNVHKAPGIILNSFNRLKYNQVRYGDLADWFKPLFLMLPLLKQQPYDIVHCHYGRNGLKAILLKDLGVINGKIITAFHGHDLSYSLQRQGDRIYNYLFERGDLFQPISHHWAKKLIELGCSPDKIVLHHMGIDTSKFIPTLAINQTSAKIIIVSVARLVEIKGLSYGIEAVGRLLTKRPQLNLEYLIVGDGVLRPQLEEQIEQLQLKDRIKLLGWKKQKQVQAIIALGDILLAPSVTSRAGNCEGIPVCLMEAMARAIPVVSTYHSGIPELVEDEVTGYLVPEKQVTALVEKLEYLIGNPSLRLQMGRAGRDKVLNEYNIELLCDRLVTIYQQLRGSHELNLSH